MYLSYGSNWSILDQRYGRLVTLLSMATITVHSNDGKRRQQCFRTLCVTYWVQTYQLSRIACETHVFNIELTLTQKPVPFVTIHAKTNHKSAKKLF